MLCRLLRISSAFVTFSFLCLAADDLKPECNRQNHGRMWPEAANHDLKLMTQLSHCGELQICGRGVWRYHWQSPTVRLDQLRGGSKLPKPAGCEERVEATASAPGAPPAGN
jgi:hypothetical protein